MDEQKNSSMGQNVENDAAKTVQDAVKMGKTAAKIAAKAAAQDYVGAAAEAVKDPETTAKIVITPIIIAAICIFLVVAILFSLPIAIYDNITAAFNDIGTRWEELWYGRDDASAIEVFWEWLQYSVTRTFAAIIDGIEDFIDPDNSDRELGMMATEETEKLALINRLCIVDQKLQNRAETLKTGLTSATLKKSLSNYLRYKYWGKTESDPDPIGCKWHTPEVTVVFQEPLETIAAGRSSERSAHLNELTTDLDNYPTTGTAEERNAWKEAFNKKIYDSENDTGYFKPENEYSSVQLLCLLSVQKGASTTDLENIDLIKSMGWTKRGLLPDNISFPVGGVESCQCVIPKWEGTFVPQYLEEEIKNITQQKVHYRRLKDADAENECITALDRYDNAGVPLTDLALRVDFPLITLNENGVVLDPEKDPNPKTTVDRRTGTTHQYYYYANPTGCGELTLHCWLYQRSETWHYQFEITTYISCRDSTEIANKIGLFDGAFDPAYAPFPTPTPTTAP